MIDPARQAAFLPVTAPHQGTAQNAAPKPVFRMISSDRMGGSIPAWVRPSGAQENTLSTLSSASGENNAGPGNALSYRGDTAPPGNINAEPFGFGDVIDMINPLQHIPLVGTLYRHLTGDQIRPSSAIVGGALFGGALGAAGSLANVIIKEESGRDLGEHALAFAGADHPSAPPPPLQQLASAGQPPELPGSALGFLDMAYNAPAPVTTPITPHQTPPHPARLAAMYKFND